MVGHVASSDDGMEFAEEARRFEAWLTHNGLTETAACLGRELARRDAGQRTVGSSSASAVASGADSALRRPSAAEGRLDSLLSRFARARQKRPGNSQATAPGVEAAAAAASAAANKAADVSAHAAAVREQVTAALHLEAADALAADQMFTAELVAARRPWQSPSDSVPDSYEGATDEWELADVGYREETAERLLIWSRRAEPDGAAPVPALDSGAVESMDLRIIYRPQHTGFEPHQEFPIVPGDLVAGRYTVLDTLGTASFCTAVHALQTDTGTNVCLKIIKNSKDNFDQALDEVKLLKLVNSKQNADASHILRLFDYFYFKEHMFLVTELGGANLFDHSNCMLQEGHRAWWTIERLQRVAYQITDALVYIHSLSLIHSDLKPENIVIKSLSPLHIRVIDFGSSCFIHDDLGVYVQSRSYRAPEVIIAAPYDYRIDNWSLGTILAELATGTVLFENENVPTMLARMAAILGPFHNHAGFLATGKETHKYFTNTMDVYMRVDDTPGDAPPTPVNSVLLKPVPSSLAARLGKEYASDKKLLHFLSKLLKVNPAERYTSAQMLAHPWLEGQKEEHDKQCAMQTPLDSQNKVAEGDPDPDDSAQVVATETTVAAEVAAATAIQSRFRGNKQRQAAAARHWQAGAAAVMAFAGEHVHSNRVTAAQASLASTSAVAGGSVEKYGKAPPPLKKRGGGEPPP